MSGSARDAALAAIKAGLSAVPVLGGPLASLLGDALQAHTDDALRRAMTLLGERLDAQQERIDLGTVNRAELAELFKSCYLLVRRTHQELKIRAAVALIANVLLKDSDPERMPYTELDHFVRCLDGLSIGAIEALAVAYTMAQGESRRPDADLFRFNFADLQQRMVGVSPELLMGLVGELSGMNLVHLAGVPAIRSPEYANYPIELTPLGIRFVERLLTLDPLPAPDRGGGHNHT